MTATGIIYGDGTTDTVAYASGTDAGQLISITSYTSGTNTYTVPSGATTLFVKCLGGGGGSAGYLESGGAGGYSETLITGLTAGNTIVATVGGGGNGVAYYAGAGSGGTSSFGAYCSATGGRGTNTQWGHTGGQGGLGSGGYVNLYGGGGIGHGNSAAQGAIGRGGASYFGGPTGYNRNTGNSKMNTGAPGAGAPGCRTDDGTTGVAGENGLIIVYAYS